MDGSKGGIRLKRRIWIGLLLLVALACGTARAQGVAERTGALHTYGGSGAEECTGVLMLGDGMLIYGNAASADGDLAGAGIAEAARAAWVLCVGLDGEIRWSRVIDRPGSSFRAASALADGTFLLALSSHVDGEGTYWTYHLAADGSVVDTALHRGEVHQMDGRQGLLHARFLKEGFAELSLTDAQGKTLWTRTLDARTEAAVFSGVAMGADGYYVRYAEHTSADPYQLEPALRKLDLQGNAVWTCSIPIPGQAYVVDLAETADGGVFAVGSGTLEEQDDLDARYVTFAARLDADGNLLWHKTYRIDGRLQLEGVVAVPGGFLAVASPAIYDFEHAAVHLVRLDEGGEVLDTWPVALAGKWHKLFPRLETAGDAAYIAGSVATHIEAAFDMDFALLITDAAR